MGERIFSVASFFLSINIGDSSIHILYSHQGPDTPKRVERAILLDGGRDWAAEEIIDPDDDDEDESGPAIGSNFKVAEPHDNIARTFETIEDTFVCRGPAVGGTSKKRNLLQFDAIVVSHWDSDHADGVMWTLWRDIRRQNNIGVPLENMRLQRARYLEDPPGVFTPVTFFYAPTWRANKYHEKITGDGNKWSTKWEKMFRTTGDSLAGPELGDNPTMEVRIDKTDVWAPNLLRVRIGAANLIGRNFFSHSDPIATAMERIESVDMAQLMERVPPETPKLYDGETAVGPVPGFYCVAVNCRVLGKTVLPQLTYKNKTSICNLVIWNDDSRRVTHYLAGDANSELEEAIVQWMNYKSDDNKSVMVAKMSHHGASSSNPRSSWARLKPYRVVISAGDHKSYGHPRWEVLHDMFSWYLYNTSFVLKAKFPLYLTQYPFYLKSGAVTNKPASLDLVEDVFKAMGDNWEAMDQLRVSLNMDRMAPSLAHVLLTLKNQTDTQRRDWIFGNIRSILLPELIGNIHNLEGDYDLGGLQYIHIDSDAVNEPWRTRSENKYKLFPPMVISNAWDFHFKSSEHHSLGCSTVSFCDRRLSCGSDASWDLVEEPHLIVPEGSKLAERGGGGDNVTVISRESCLYPFLLFSASQQIKLQNRPEPGKEVKFTADDEWQAWLRRILGASAAVLKVTFASWPPTTKEFGDYEMEAAWNAGGKERKLVLKSKGAAVALGVDNPALATMLTMTRVLPFAVTEPVASSWTLGEVADHVNFRHGSIIDLLRDVPLIMTTGDTTRNIIWFEAGTAHNTSTRLEFTVPKDKYAPFKEWLDADAKKFDVQEITVIARRDASLSYNAKKDNIGSAGALIFRIKLILCGATFAAQVEFTSDDVRMRLQKEPQPNGGTYEALVDWAVQTLGIKGFECKSWTEAAGSFLSGIRPRSIDMTLTYKDGKLRGIEHVGFVLQVEVSRGKKVTTLAPNVDESIVFFITYAWSRTQSSVLRGKLWAAPKKRLEDTFARGLPKWESYLLLQPDIEGHALDHIDLKALLSLESLPPGVPSEVRGAELQIDSEGIQFTGLLACSDLSDDSKVPMLAVEELELSCRMTWADKTPRVLEMRRKGEPDHVQVLTAEGATWRFSLRVDMLLMPMGEKVDNASSDGFDAAARIRGEINYGSKMGWRLLARIDQLKVSHLVSFWDRDSRDGAMSLLKDLRIDYIELRYLYLAVSKAKTNTAERAGGKSFRFLGALSFGDLQLRLNFNHDGTQWQFGANLGLKDDASGSATVKTLLDTIMGVDAPKLPDVIADVVLAKPGNENEILGFKCAQVNVAGSGSGGSGGRKLIVFTASVHISSISLTFVQWRDTSWQSTTPSKRIIKVSIGDMGDIDAPLVGKLKQPFDQLVYMWVSDKATAVVDKAAKPGVTKGDLDALLPRLEHDQDKLFFKSNKEPSAIKPNEIVIEPGSHFMVVATNSKGLQAAVLDYRFNRPKGSEKKDRPSGWDDCDEWLIEDGEQNDEDVSKAAFKVSAGPLVFENIGLKYIQEENRLGVVLDASLLMGPIGISLMGFCLSLKLGEAKSSDAEHNSSSRIALPESHPSALPCSTPIIRAAHNTVQHIDGCQLPQQVTDFGLPVSSPKVDLAGLAISFDRPPLTIAGGFAKTEMKDGVYYAGGLIIGFEPWMIQAVGVYGEVAKPSLPSPQSQRSGFVMEAGEDDKKDTFTMVFIIFKLNGPLFTIGFADIAGLTGGAGVNSNVRLPNAATVLDFPFVKPRGTDTSGGPLKALKGLLKPDSGEPWFTAREGSFWVAAGLRATAFQMLAVDAVVVVQLNPDVQLGIYAVAVCDVPTPASPIKFAHVELGIACTLDIAAGVFKVEAQLSPQSFVLHESCHLTGGLALFSWFGDSPYAGDWVMTIGGFHQAFDKPLQYPRPPRLGIAWSLGENLRITGEAYFAITPRVCMGGGRLHAQLTLGALSAWFDAFLDFLINYRPFCFAAVGGVSIGVRFSLDLWLVTIRISCEIGATLTVAGPPMAGTVHVDFWVFGFDVDFGDRAGMARPDRLSLGDFKALALKSASSGVSVPLASGWLDVASGQNDDDDEDDFDKEEAPPKAFLFNCVGGLVPEGSDAKGPEANVWYEDKPAKMWLVRGGELSFSITTSFAASDGVLFDDRKGAITPKKSVEIADAQKKVYALPMCLQQTVVSTIVVRIARVANDPEKDPVLKGNHVSGLLDGKPADAPPLVMGLTIEPPKPYISRDAIPKFNLVEDLKLTVDSKGFPFKRKETASPMWAPRHQDGSWKDFKEKWQSQPDNRPEEAVHLWAERLKFKGLTGSRPKALLKRFDDIVPALPLIALGAGS
ncbi:hypothetical protein ACHAP9_007602 [Verticillium nonalfalfae]